MTEEWFPPDIVSRAEKDGATGFRMVCVSWIKPNGDNSFNISLPCSCVSCMHASIHVLLDAAARLNDTLMIQATQLNTVPHSKPN